MRQVLILMEVDTDDPKEAERIVVERARLSWGKATVIDISALTSPEDDASSTTDAI